MDEKILTIVLKARDEASKELQKVGKEAGGVANILAGSFKNAAIVSGVALAGVTAEAFRSIDAFQESQKVLAQTDAVLRSTKGAAGVTAEAVSDLAAKLQRTTGISDETVQSAENMLLTFTKVGKDVFPAATKTILDMSVALGQDTKNSAIQLGKALNDPINGVTALRRVGVTFTEAQQQQIEKLQKSGDLLGAQKIVLKELQTEFGGSADAAGKTFGGQLNILKNSVNDLEEAFGGLLVKAISPFLPKLTDFATIMNDWVTKGKDVNIVAQELQQKLGGFGKVIGDTILFFSQNHDALIALAGVIGGVFMIAIVAAGAAMISFIGLSLPILGVFAVIGAGVALAIAHWKELQKWAGTITKSVGDFFVGLGKGISGVVNGIITDIKNMVNSIIDTVNKLIRGVNGVGSKIGLGSVKIPEIPKFEQGGWVPATGLAVVHQGEYVLSRDMLAGRQPAAVQTSNYNQPINVYATINTPLDMNQLAYMMAYELRNRR